MRNKRAKQLRDIARRAATVFGELERKYWQPRDGDGAPKGMPIPLTAFYPNGHWKRLYRALKSFDVVLTQRPIAA